MEQPERAGFDTLPPMVVAHDRDQLRLAVATARHLRIAALGLLSAPFAACFLGAPWWRALVADAPASPDLTLLDWLDCGDAAGRALEALRLGQTRLLLARSCPQFQAVAERAALAGGSVLPDRPAALDLADRQAARDLAAWLAPGSP